MRVAGKIVVALVVQSALGGALSGQGAARVSVFPRVGLAAPDGYFYEYFDNFYGDGPMEWTTGYLGRAFAAGIGVQVEFGRGDFFLRGEVLRTFDGWLSSVYSLERPRVLFEPPVIDNTWLDIPARITATSLQAILPLRLRLWRISPYVLAGVGGKFYGFGDPVTVPDGVDATLPSDGFTWGGDVGAGITVPVQWGLLLDLQVRDGLSRYWGKTQHDLFYTAAVLWSVF